MTYWQTIHADRQHPSAMLFLAGIFLGWLWVCGWLHLGSRGSLREKLGTAAIKGTFWHALLRLCRAGPSATSGLRAMVQWVLWEKGDLQFFRLSLRRKGSRQGVGSTVVGSVSHPCSAIHLLCNLVLTRFITYFPTWNISACLCFQLSTWSVRSINYILEFTKSYHEIVNTTNTQKT